MNRPATIASMIAPSHMQDGIAEALARLEIIENTSDKPPAMIVLPPDSGQFIIGNSGGFVSLAIAALKAAQGEPQPFKNARWVGEQDLDWALKGLQHDPDAHIYLPPTPTIWLKTMRFIVPVFLMLCLVIGFASVVQWGYHLVGRLH